MEGNVKWYNRKKGYGFVSGDDGEDYFVHHQALGQGVFLRENDKVSFEPVDTDKGKQAQNVQLLEKGSERTDLPPAEDAPADAPVEDAPADAPAEAPAEPENQGM